MSTSEAVSPYVAARHEWDERYGSLITQARNWRVAFQVSAVIALVVSLRILRKRGEILASRAPD